MVQCNFMIIFSGNAIFGQINVMPLKVLIITVMHFSDIESDLNAHDQVKCIGLRAGEISL